MAPLIAVPFQAFRPSHEVSWPCLMLTPLALSYVSTLALSYVSTLALPYGPYALIAVPFQAFWPSYQVSHRAARRWSRRASLSRRPCQRYSTPPIPLSCVGQATRAIWQVFLSFQSCLGPGELGPRGMYSTPPPSCHVPSAVIYPVRLRHFLLVSSAVTSSAPMSDNTHHHSSDRPYL